MAHHSQETSAFGESQPRVGFGLDISHTRPDHENVGTDNFEPLISFLSANSDSAGLQQARDTVPSSSDGQPAGHGRSQPHCANAGSNASYTTIASHDMLDGQHMQDKTGGDVTDDYLEDGATDTLQLVGDGGKTEDDNTAIPPPWSELKTKAGKERKRLPLACIACRRKKIRCSGEKPACKHCLRSRIPCTYRVTARKAAPRTDYMVMLDKRLKRMEDRVIKIIPKNQQNIVANTGRAIVKPSLPEAPPKSAGSSKKRAAELAFVNEVDEWASSSQKKLPTSKATPALSVDAALVEARDHEEQNSLLAEGADKLPPKELQEHLAEVFFDFIYGQSYHLLHKPSFMRRLAQGTVPPVLTLAVCAISARFSGHPAVRTEPAFLRGESWASAARDIALRRYDTPNITILIVYLILGLHEFGTCQGGRSWMFGGMAQRMAYALQLHKDLDHDTRVRTPGKNSELTFTDREIRRRTMWSCFLMDRFNSSGTERPIFVGEQYIIAQLPIRERYFQMEITGPTEDLEGSVPNPVQTGQGQMANPKENMGVAAYLVRLVAIWGKLINYLNLGGKERDAHPMWSEKSRFDSIRLEVQQWHELLPDHLRNTPENLQNHASEKIANQFLFLHIVHAQILLFMNRFALPSSGSRPVLPRDMPEQFISEASRTALRAANQISILINSSMDHSVVAPFAGYCAFLSSTVHIQGAFSENSQLEASSKQYLAWNVKYLSKMKKYWGMFHFVTENLRDLYRRHADAARSGAKTSSTDQQAIFQYGDWFDRYPHGVSGTDYEEPSIDIEKEAGSDAVLGQKSDLKTVEEFFSKLSPPTKAAQGQQMQQQTARKAAKKRHSKFEGSEMILPASGGQQDMNIQPGALQTAAQQVTHDLASTQSFQNTAAGFRHQSSNLTEGFPIPMAGSQQFLPQLDRQMVLNSYANANSNLQANTAPTSLDNASNLDNVDWNAIAANNNVNSNGNGFWGDPPTAWFMPFNMNPPAIGEDNNLLNDDFNWANNFAGFDDMTGIDLPPGDGGQDRASQILDGFDQMQ